MGWLIPKTYLKWREPKSVRRVLGRAQIAKWGRWDRLLAVVLLVGCGMLGWSFHNPSDGEKASLWSLLFWTLVIATTYVWFVMPWIFRSPLHVTVSEKAITASNGLRHTFRYDNIMSCLIARRESNEGMVPILVVTPKKGDSIALGIAEEVSLEELRSVLVGRGVQITLDVEDISSSEGC